MLTHPPDPITEPSLIGLDWGTSSLRAYLISGDGVVIESCHRPWGIQHLPAGGYAEAFRTVVGDWRQRSPRLPVIAAGMVGSRTGWYEVPYVDCPADTHAIAKGMKVFDSECGPLHLVPGVMQGEPAPDVMRGEETQIVGAIAREPGIAATSLVVLPGTHCKWARIENGRMTRFTTYMTGELFALLRDHSIVGVPARNTAASTDSARQTAFRRGLAVARGSGEAGIAGKLFTARSMFLGGQLAAGDTLDYISGLIVGEELRSGIAALGGHCPSCVLVGESALCSRYREAFSVFGITNVRQLDDTGPIGLWSIASAAGLIPTVACSAAEPACRG